MSKQPLIDDVIRGTTPDARRSLLKLLLDVEKVGVNFEAVCQTPNVCRDILAVTDLVTLRHALAFSLVREMPPAGEPPRSELVAVDHKEP